MKDTKKYFKLTFTSILIALMFALSWTVLGMVPLGLASATTVFIPVVIGIVCMDDFRLSAVLGVAFGVVSLIRATVPQGILDPFFINPLVSVLPRFIATMLTHLCYRSLKKLWLNKNTGLKICNSAIAGGLMALFNTIFTISMLLLIYNKDLSQMFGEYNTTMTKFIADIALLNMLPEIAFGTAITVAVFSAYNRIFMYEPSEE